ncbi:Glutaredoxin [Diplodia corticola]|uniref:Glutaredoxin n=1 Tax=Diplodia corticola TaxID=236234 RepID=A0A1J9QN98_9PEZI|nr:Glutaredoxin [Diplodia corticola]OJD29937.1 Glutaredoxin [Diplodia corticola]
MAPRILQNSAASRPRAHFTAKPEAIVHTSKMFKNHAQHNTTARSKAAPLTKYELTSKPHGISKYKSQGRGPTRQVRKPDHPLFMLFDAASPATATLPSPHQSAHPLLPLTESSTTYRNTIITNAQDSLLATRHALEHRLTSTNGAGEQQQQQQEEEEHNPPARNTTPPNPFAAAAAFSPPPDPNRLPTAAELRESHNALVAKVTAPFGETKVVRGRGGIKAGRGVDDDAAAAAAHDGGGGGGGQQKGEMEEVGDDVLAAGQQGQQPLAAVMADFAAVVAREEKRLRELGGRWVQTRAEIRLLAEDIFGEAAVRDMVKGKKGKAGGEVVEEVGRGLGKVEVEALRRVVEEMVGEAAGEAERVREAERKVKREQRKMILATVKRMEEL